MTNGKSTTNDWTQRGVHLLWLVGKFGYVNVKAGKSRFSEAGICAVSSVFEWTNQVIPCSLIVPIDLAGFSKGVVKCDTLFA